MAAGLHRAFASVTNTANFDSFTEGAGKRLARSPRASGLDRGQLNTLPGRPQPGIRQGSRSGIHGPAIPQNQSAQGSAPDGAAQGSTPGVTRSTMTGRTGRHPPWCRRARSDAPVRGRTHAAGRTTHQALRRPSGPSGQAVGCHEAPHKTILNPVATRVHGASQAD